MKLGCHISAIKYNELVDIALKLNTNTMQFFSRSSYGVLPKLDSNDIALFNEKLKINNFDNIVIHAPFIINGASNKDSVRLASPNIIKEDIERIDMFDTNCFYVLHPGNHMGNGSDKGCALVSEMLNKAIKKEQHTIILLETMSGKGTELGRTFEELQKIINKIDLKEKIGICLDTCHIWDGGYNLNNIDDILNEFDTIIGFEYLKVVHLNNSKNDVGSHKDRHESIRNGMIPLEIFDKIINHTKLKDIIYILETPESTYNEDLALLKSLLKK